MPRRRRARTQSPPPPATYTPAAARPNEPTLSPSATRNINLALAHGWSLSTKANYGSATRRFLTFCKEEGIPSPNILPASESVLCAFAASHARTRAGTTARNNIAAVKAWHAYHNAPWYGGARLRYVLNGVANLAPPTSVRPKRPPVTTAMLDLLVKELDHSSPFDACVLAVALTAFWGQCRIGELLPNTTSADVKKRPVVCNLTLRPTRGDTTSILHLPSTKTALVRGEDVSLISRRKAPVDAL